MPLRPPPPSVEVFTDASLQGWGVHDSWGRRLQGQWSPLFRTFHINVLELVAIFLAIKRLRFPPLCHIRLHSDNMTAVNCLNRCGSARSFPLNSWIVSILRLLSRRSLHLTACHIAGVKNVVADGLSRNVPLSSEWSLDVHSFQLLCRREFVPEVDLFATRENHKVPQFVSPLPDPLAVAVDAFSLDWNRWRRIYLFPPSALILRVLVLLQHFQGQALLITPAWTNQPWYPLALQLARHHWDLPCPVLSQRVGENIICNSSKIYRHLLCWIF